MPFKKNQLPITKAEPKFKHVMLLAGYEFRNMNKD